MEIAAPIALILPSRAEAELDEEIRFHIEERTAELIAGGRSPDEARAEAWRAFGGVEQVKEECRDAWGLRWLWSVLEDLRYGWRIIWHSPGFTLVVVLSLAIGIGANTRGQAGPGHPPAPDRERAVGDARRDGRGRSFRRNPSRSLGDRPAPDARAPSRVAPGSSSKETPKAASGCRRRGTTLSTASDASVRGPGERRVWYHGYS